MSWIVPSLAAEMWGVPLDHVIRGIQEGSIASRHEHGFVFVRWGEHHEPQAAPAVPVSTNNTVMAASAETDAIAVASAADAIAPALAPVMSSQYPSDDQQNADQVAALSIRPDHSTTDHSTTDNSTTGVSNNDSPGTAPEGELDDHSDLPQADQDYLNFLQHSGDWRRARREAAKLRQPPTSQAKAA
jgi:hypothetical protein